MKKNLFFTLCFSLCPGAGQMYQGYMKRGLSILILFAISFAIFATVEVPFFAIPLPVIFIYSFFDTFNIRSILGTDEKFEDKYIWETSEILKTSSVTKSSSIKKFFGIILVFVGVYILIYNTLPSIFRAFGLSYIARYLNIAGSYLTPILISVLSIFFGMKMIIKK